MMSIKKKIVFLTGTRADFGKIKSLIKITNHSKLFDVNIFVTGMHLDRKYGYTIGEIRLVSNFLNHNRYMFFDSFIHFT